MMIIQGIMPVLDSSVADHHACIIYNDSSCTIIKIDLPIFLLLHMLISVIELPYNLMK